MFKRIVTALAIVVLLAIAATPVGSQSIERAHSRIVRMLFGDGTALLPSMAFATQPNTGIYHAGVNDISMSSNGSRVAAFSGADFYLVGANPIIQLGASSDVQLTRDGAADAFAQRRTTNGQTFRLYNTWTDASNYERVGFQWTGNVAQLLVQQAGTGNTTRAMTLGTTGTGALNFATNNTSRWAVDGSGGQFVALIDNTYDIGQTGALRPRTVYVGTNVIAGGSVQGVNLTSPFASGSVGFASGAGGTVTQATSKATGVQLDRPAGAITLNAAALAASTTVSFVLTSNAIGGNDVIILNHISGGTPGSYTINARCANGSATIDVRNISLGSLSEAIVIQYVVIKGATT